MKVQVARAGVLALCGVCLTGSWAVARQAPPQNPPQTQRPPTFRGGANFVLVDVYPTEAGRIVEGLKQSDFQVLENGKPQSVEQFEFVRVEPSPEAARRDPSTQAEALDQAADPHNRVFVLYLDHYHVTVEGSHATPGPLLELLDRVLAPNDLFGVITPRRRPRDLVFGRKTTSLERQLTDNWIWGLQWSKVREPDEQAFEGCFKYFETDPRSGKPRYVDDGAVKREIADVITARYREDKVLTHLEDLVAYLGGIREARKSVVLFTNGWLLYPPDPRTVETVISAQRDFQGPQKPAVGTGPGGTLMIGSSANVSSPTCNVEFQRLFMLDNQKRLRDITALANRHNVTFYPVNPSGIDVFDAPLSDRPVVTDSGAAFLQDQNRLRFRTESMQTLAGATDGLAVITNDLRGGLRRIVNDVSAYYVLGYYSTDRRFDGGYRRIEVKLAKPGVSVNARRGYFAPTETAVAADGTPKPTLAAAVPSGVSEVLGVLAKLQSAAELFSYATLEGGDVHVAIELSVGQSGQPRWAQGADVQVSIARTSGDTAVTATGRIDSGARGVLVRVPLAAAYGAGPWRAIVKVPGTPTLDDRTDVRTTTSTVLGRPIVYRAMPAGTSPLRPVADFQFRRTERAHVEWPIRGAIDERAARLLTRAGQPLPVPVTLTERDVDGRRVLAADLVLAPLAEGDYVIELSAGSVSAPERQHVAIRITR